MVMVQDTQDPDFDGSGDGRCIGGFVGAAIVIVYVCAALWLLHRLLF
jgi:hypothetical protein